MNPVLVFLAIGSGALFLGRKKRVATTTTMNVDATIPVNDEFEIVLPKQAASFAARAVGATKGIVEVIERSDSPKGTYYIVGRNPGLVEVAFYDKPDRTNLFARFTLSITG